MTAQNQNRLQSWKNHCASEKSLQQNLFCLPLLILLCSKRSTISEALTSSLGFAQSNEARDACVSEMVGLVNNTVEGSEKEFGLNCPISDCFYENGCSSAIRSMCNFTVSESDEIWLILSKYTSSKHNVSRRRKSNLSEKDMLFTSMYVLNHGEQWDFTDKLFNIANCTIEHQVNKELQLIGSVIFENLVMRAEEMSTIGTLKNLANPFKHFSYAWYATNVTFEQTNHPSESMAEGKKYFQENTSYTIMKRSYWFY